ncbi:hypothetical protein G5V59_21200 [Nocardioides sp. W3-2-3]|uniref:hypothetical protein n=1 Tax=Nocardioides convexus TaxID=2712224 RepID=UPI00241862E9|nr:hypothetical protein [Nocardioides convexus]NHA01473.1 hypothetical protein [Nocardioides convexus]
MRPPLIKPPGAGTSIEAMGLPHLFKPDRRRDRWAGLGGGVHPRRRCAGRPPPRPRAARRALLRRPRRDSPSTPAPRR